MSGEAPPRLGINQPPTASQQSSQSSGMPPTQVAATGPTRTGHSTNDPLVLIEPGKVCETGPTPVDKEYRYSIPVSRQAARDAFLAMGHNPQGLRHKIAPPALFYIKPPTAELVQAIANVEDSYPV